jgi:type II secretory ATPase GspE/PulE/Tfp pilus assembly ATPase PilB-like protein
MTPATATTTTSRLVRFELSPTLARELNPAPTDGPPRDPLDSGRRLAQTLLEDAVRQRATDIHLDPQTDATRVRFRIDGTLFDTAVLTREQGGRVIRHLKAMSGLDSADRFHPADARLTEIIDDREIDLRLAALPCVGGEKLAVRLLDRARILHRINELGLSTGQQSTLEEWLGDMCGMFLVAGPTGSGKTTTAYALLHELALHERCVVTVEDPVEYRIDGITQIQTDRRHGLSFADGLRATLRADPDYLFVGEIRDDQAARAALEASGSGRVLMSTIHAPDAIGTVTALRNFGLADHQIASSLRLVVAQRLVRRLCPHCRAEADFSDADRQWLTSAGLVPTADRTWAPVGCENCRNLGYHGRTGIFEVWRLDDADYQAVLRHDDERALRAAATSRGLRTLLQDGLAKVEAGVTSLAELRSLGSTCQPRCPA